MKNRKIIYIIITAICVVSIIVAVYHQIFSKKVINENVLNEISNNVEEPDTTSDHEDLVTEFNKLFTNTFYKQNNSTDGITKIAGLEDKDIIYSAYNIVKEKKDSYNIDLQLPVYNIAGEVASEFNGRTQLIFADKASAILAEATEYTVYNVKYVAYLNDDILSLIIKATLKEGNGAQRIIVQAYNYNITTNTAVTLNEVLAEKNISTSSANKKIETQVKDAKEQAETISGATGQAVYKRDLNNAMYLTDNVSNFFIGKNGQIYIVYAYGNNNMTSEIDIIKL